jgi:hypothetical protein
MACRHGPHNPSCSCSHEYSSSAPFPRWLGPAPKPRHCNSSRCIPLAFFLWPSATKAVARVHQYLLLLTDSSFSSPCPPAESRYIRHLPSSIECLMKTKSSGSLLSWLLFFIVPFFPLLFLMRIFCHLFLADGHIAYYCTPTTFHVAFSPDLSTVALPLPYIYPLLDTAPNLGLFIMVINPSNVSQIFLKRMRASSLCFFIIYTYMVIFPTVYSNLLFFHFLYFPLTLQHSTMVVSSHVALNKIDHGVMILSNNYRSLSVNRLRY